MSQYCTANDIENYYLGKSFNAGDFIESGEVNLMIDQAAAQIDSMIKARYSLPITNASDLLILKTINEKMVVGDIDDIFREKNSDGEFERGRNTKKEAMEWLKKISCGEMLLNSTQVTSGIKFNQTDSDGNTVTKKFKDSDIEPSLDVLDRERRSVVRFS